ncbi:hypothetical protein HHK36_032133 [Tetracentron sinense]|uniref:Pentatricopeptide repeat-containing protein n=1 Tax=Tetracentron sinense TaxID=13715 RepID=A0A834Y8F5_TETSI|nr:hypothetical protein HHK36_032133 [Tetracentron sinense]
MGGLCDSGRLKEAVELFEEMVSKVQVMPDALTYNVLVNGFCREGKVDQARKIMDFMRKNGCCPNIFNYSALMNGFCKEGRVEEAIFMRKSGLKVDVVAYDEGDESGAVAAAAMERVRILEEVML